MEKSNEVNAEYLKDLILFQTNNQKYRIESLINYFLLLKLDGIKMIILTGKNNKTKEIKSVNCFLLSQFSIQFRMECGGYFKLTLESRTPKVVQFLKDHEIYGFQWDFIDNLIYGLKEQVGYCCEHFNETETDVPKVKLSAHFKEFTIKGLS